MGFFSWLCVVCTKEILSVYVNDLDRIDPKWYQVVFVNKEGKAFEGDYGGYGDIKGENPIDFYKLYGDPSAYHKHCYTGDKEYYRSRDAPRQGYFFDDESGIEALEEYYY